MKLVVVKSSFQVLLVPNWRVFRITVIYVIILLKLKIMWETLYGTMVTVNLNNLNHRFRYDQSTVNNKFRNF